jgi:hypothetical protein
MAHRYVLSAGHRNTNRGGASGEIEWTYPSCIALKKAIEARGGQAVIVQEEDGDGDPSFFKNGGLQEAARTCQDLADSNDPFNAYISSHYNGGASPGFHAIFPDGKSGTGDSKADNPKDVDLCRAIRDRVKATNSVAMLSWTADSPGVMSERETGVGAQGFRLGEFVGTIGIRSTTARVVIEAGSIDVARERAFINDKDWVRNVYAEAVVDALEEVFGAFPRSKAELSDEFVAPKPRPALTQYRDRDEVSIPAAINDDNRWYFWIGQEVTVIKQTPRMQTADENAPSVGPDLMPASADEPADRFFAAWGSVADNGRPFTHTFFDTRVWLDDTDFGVLQ